VAFLVGVGLDGERALGDLGAEVLEVGPACFFKLPEPCAVLLDNPQVVRGRERRLALGEEEIAGEPGAHLDELSGLAEVGDRVGQEQADVAVLGPERMVLPPFNARLARGTGRLLGPLGGLGLAAGLGGCLGFGPGAFGIGGLGHGNGSFSIYRRIGRWAPGRNRSRPDPAPSHFI